MQITVNSPAKLNLFLDIDGRRNDGYHLMKMVMQSIDLCDRLVISKTSSGGIDIVANRRDIPLDEDNIISKAAAAFFKAVEIENSGLCVELTKRIPFGAGLGGGSADGAGMLVALNRLFDTGLTQKELIDIGKTVGADIPFCLVGGAALVEGIGECVTPIEPMPACHIVVAKPNSASYTAKAFKAYDNAPKLRHKDIASILFAFKNASLHDIANSMHNIFEQVLELEQSMLLCKRMTESGAIGARLTGSGSAVFGIFEDNKKAWQTARQLDATAQVFLCRPITGGAYIEQ